VEFEHVRANFANREVNALFGPTPAEGLNVYIVGVVVLAFLLTFIIQNGQSVKVSFFTANVKMPLGVALLLAAVGGVLLAGIVASLRIWQLRHRLHQSK
jgi:uncharacterized integral membrane protein